MISEESIMNQTCFYIMLHLVLNYRTGHENVWCDFFVPL